MENGTCVAALQILSLERNWLLRGYGIIIRILLMSSLILHHLLKTARSSLCHMVIIAIPTKIRRRGKGISRAGCILWANCKVVLRSNKRYNGVEYVREESILWLSSCDRGEKRPIYY